jgi:hypothetical protein
MAGRQVGSCCTSTPAACASQSSYGHCNCKHKRHTSTAQHSTAQHSTAQHSTAQYPSACHYSVSQVLGVFVPDSCCMREQERSQEVCRHPTCYLLLPHLYIPTVILDAGTAYCSSSCTSASPSQTRKPYTCFSHHNTRAVCAA